MKLRFATFLAWMAAVTLPLLGAEPAAGKPVAIGASAPRFKLTDQTGKTIALEDLLKQGNVALVFYRSADW